MPRTAPDPAPSAAESAAESTESTGPAGRRRAAGCALVGALALVLVGTSSPALAVEPAPSPSSDTPPAPAPASTRLTLSTPAQVDWTRAATLVVRLARTDGTAVEGASVLLYARPYGRSAFAGLARVTTGADGTATFAYRPDVVTAFTARWSGDDASGASDAGQTVVAVTPKLVSSLSAVSVPVRSTLTLSGAVGPARPGKVVGVQEFRDGAWRHLAAARLDADSRFVVPIEPTTRGTHRYRAFVPAIPTHLQAVGLEQRVGVGDRTLSRGDRGEDVKEVQLRLAELRYDVGAAEGRYGYDTAHAVQAFQKVQGLPRTMVVDARTRAALARPRLPVLRQSRSGTWVEADLTRQVLYIGRAGRLHRVLDISSGNNELYTVDGETSRAVTPTGQFRINRKINGQRESRLGVLYKPAYFNNTGYAIHGSPSVPAFPASHGCIRITNPAADRYYETLSVGVPVSIYRS